MEKFTIRILEEETTVVSKALKRTEKTELINRLEEKYGGKVKLVTTTIYTPILKKDGD